MYNLKHEHMKPLAKLIHRTHASYLPTAFPAHYYGMPNGKIYLVFSRFYDSDIGNSGIEFVFAEHKDFSYDYEKETIRARRRTNKSLPIFAEYVDNPDTRITVFTIERNLNSYGEAQRFLNREAEKMQQYA